MRNPLDSSKQHVLGRIDDCDIFIDDKVMSKRHCTFQYMPGPAPIRSAQAEAAAGASLQGFDLAGEGGHGEGSRNSRSNGSCEGGHWVLKDGYASASLNGTWAYLSQETPVRDKMTFKASEILFEASLR